MTFQLFNEDCLQKMKDISDNSIDLFICDLPFGCLTQQKTSPEMEKKYGKGRRNTFEGCSWDIKLNLEEFWKQVKRIRKDDHSPCIHFCSTKFGNDLINSNPTEFRYDLVWNKLRGVGFLSANKKPMSSHEMIYVFSKKGANYNRIDIEGEPYQRKRKDKKTLVYNTVPSPDSTNIGTRCVLSVIEQSNSIHKKGQHPTEKIKALYEWLISRYSNPGDTILDPTFGSCNSGAVARELGRNFIGIEMNEGFYHKAVERFITE